MMSPQIKSEKSLIIILIKLFWVFLDGFDLLPDSNSETNPIIEGPTKFIERLPTDVVEHNTIAARTAPPRCVFLSPNMARRRIGSMIGVRAPIADNDDIFERSHFKPS